MYPGFIIGCCHAQAMWSVSGREFLTWQRAPCGSASADFLLTAFWNLPCQGVFFLNVYNDYPWEVLRKGHHYEFHIDTITGNDYTLSKERNAKPILNVIYDWTGFCVFKINPSNMRSSWEVEDLWGRESSTYWFGANNVRTVHLI